MKPILFIVAIMALIAIGAPRHSPVTVKYGNDAKLAFVYDCTFGGRTDCIELSKDVTQWPIR